MDLIFTWYYYINVIDGFAWFFWSGLKSFTISEVLLIPQRYICVHGSEALEDRMIMSYADIGLVITNWG